MRIFTSRFSILFNCLKRLFCGYSVNYLWHTYKTLQFLGIAGGCIATFISGSILTGIVTSLFIASFILSQMLNSQKGRITHKEVETANIEKPLPHSSCADPQFNKSVRSKLQVIPVLTEQLQSVINQTNEAAEGLIGAFMGISRNAKKQMQDVRGVFGNLSEQTSDNNILFQTQENLQKIQSNFVTLASFFDNSLRMISGVLEELEKIDSFARTIIKIGKTTNILALNASIEAANTGEAGRGFKVIASEINSLSRKSTESIKEITEINENLSLKVNAIKQELQLVQQRSQNIGSNTDELFTNTTKKITTTLQDTAERMKMVAGDAENLSKEISKVVVSIQFQDITRQRIEHVILPLETLNKELNLLIDGKLNTDEHDFNQKDSSITDTLMKQYTMESEREILKKHNNHGI